MRPGFQPRRASEHWGQLVPAQGGLQALPQEEGAGPEERKGRGEASWWTQVSGHSNVTKAAGWGEDTQSSGGARLSGEAGASHTRGPCLQAWLRPRTQDSPHLEHVHLQAHLYLFVMHHDAFAIDKRIKQTRYTAE